MTQQPDRGASTMMPSLEAKLRQFAGDLTEEELAQLSAVQTQSGANAPSPALRAKAEQLSARLTTEEATQLHHLVVGVGAGAAADAEGYAVGLYTGDYGNKGRPQPGVPANAAGGMLGPRQLLYFGIGVLQIVALLDGPGGGAGPAPHT